MLGGSWKPILFFHGTRELTQFKRCAGERLTLRRLFLHSERKKSSQYRPYLLALFTFFAEVRIFTTSGAVIQGQSVSQRSPSNTRFISHRNNALIPSFNSVLATACSHSHDDGAPLPLPHFRLPLNIAHPELSATKEFSPSTGHHLLWTLYHSRVELNTFISTHASTTHVCGNFHPKTHKFLSHQTRLRLNHPLTLPSGPWLPFLPRHQLLCCAPMVHHSSQIGVLLHQSRSCS